MNPKLTAYQKCPVVAFVGNGLKPNENFNHAQVFAAGKEGIARNYLIEEVNKVKKHINKVFDSFDKDASGLIDACELAQVAEELGLEDMGGIEAERMIKDLDLNGDGLISPSEF